MRCFFCVNGKVLQSYSQAAFNNILLKSQISSDNPFVLCYHKPQNAKKANKTKDNQTL